MSMYYILFIPNRLPLESTLDESLALGDFDMQSLNVRLLE